MVTSREAILQACRHIVAEEGIRALNIRSVASQCHIALGTLYHYYADKDSLMLATVESIWKGIFHTGRPAQPGCSFPDYIAEMYERIRTGAQAYPGFLAAHSVCVAGKRRDEAKSMMERTFQHMKAVMLGVLQGDPSVSAAIFSASFTRENLIDLVLDQLLVLLVQGQADCNILLEVIRRVIYAEKCSAP